MAIASYLVASVVLNESVSQSFSNSSIFLSSLLICLCIKPCSFLRKPIKTAKLSTFDSWCQIRVVLCWLFAAALVSTCVEASETGLECVEIGVKNEGVEREPHLISFFSRRLADRLVTSQGSGRSDWNGAPVRHPPPTDRPPPAGRRPIATRSPADRLWSQRQSPSIGAANRRAISRAPAKIKWRPRGRSFSPRCSASSRPVGRTTSNRNAPSSSVSWPSTGSFACLSVYVCVCVCVCVCVVELKKKINHRREQTTAGR